MNDREGLDNLSEDPTVKLHSFSDFDQMNRYALTAILEALGAHAGSLFLWDECGKEFVLKASMGPYVSQLQKVNIKLNEGVLGWVSERGDSVLVKNINEDARFQDKKRHDYRSGSFICIPLISHNKLIGAVNITERENLVPFDEEDVTRAKVLARHFVIAFENLKRFTRLIADRQELHRVISNLREEVQVQNPSIAIEKMVNDLAYELNNPLDAVRRYVNLSYDSAIEDSTLREYLSKAKVGIHRAIYVIRKLLEFSKSIRQSGFPGQSLSELVDGTLKSIAPNPSYQEASPTKKERSA
jgi:signal transduction protein with GAF and PtsI domain